MAAVDSTVVNVALPRIGRDLGLGLAGREWVFLVLARPRVALPARGRGRRPRRPAPRVRRRDARVRGRLRARRPAQDSAMLIAARALQGCGAFVTTTSLALLRSTYGRDSGRAVGLWTAWTGVATVVGPPVGGALVQWASWRWIFYLNLPIAALRHGRAPQRPGRAPREAAAVRRGRRGALRGGVRVGDVRARRGAEAGPRRRLVGGGRRARRARGCARARGADGRPMLPLRPLPAPQLRDRQPRTLLVYAALGGSTFYLVLYLQSVVGYSPFVASLPLVPISLIVIALAGFFGRQSDRHGPRLYLTVGPVLLGCRCCSSRSSRPSPTCWRSAPGSS